MPSATFGYSDSRSSAQDSGFPEVKREARRCRSRACVEDDREGLRRGADLNGAEVGHPAPPRLAPACRRRICHSNQHERLNSVLALTLTVSTGDGADMRIGMSISIISICVNISVSRSIRVFMTECSACSLAQWVESEQSLCLNKCSTELGQTQALARTSCPNNSEHLHLFHLSA